MSGLTKRHVLAGAFSLTLAAGTAEAKPTHRKMLDKSAGRPDGEGGERQGDRIAFTAEEAAHARPAGLPQAFRIAGDDSEAFAALLAGASRATDPWLVMSGGGENGAFGAGLLCGWSQAGNRPEFGVITGVSTGALIAPFAFVGAQADDALRRNYTEISAADVFEFGATPVSLTDTWPLKERIDAAVTPALLKAVAAEHAKGRRLLVATTQIDTERPILWDMGALASEGGPAALTLFRAIILASTAVPGVFPPVRLPVVSAEGKAFEELHADGGAMGPFFLAPAEAVAGETNRALTLPAREVYLIVHNRLTPEFQMAGLSTLGVLGRSMSAAIKAQTRAALALTRAYAARTNLDLRVAQIDGRFPDISAAPFDRGYMRALFAHGEALGRDGTGFAPAAQSNDRALAAMR
ncbi:patatin-like phospholipase family protein [Methylobacterium organophilum]|uniref:PNPLA domain-containing protein n=1 Tax=Methylobacterium organophilum TaxID=410 RepID=A0ABQ4TBN6_METOR|nr:patatin-like phospholipase family protein [Methylobacterium organophilum]GJE27472.1 hypothetical protein LKMONMHP_2331 [Methylobacterium organophilum]